MKKLFFLMLLIFGCNVTEPDDNTNTDDYAQMQVIYNKGIEHGFGDSYYSYSATAQISWSGGSVVVSNSTYPQTIRVPDGERLIAKYEKYHNGSLFMEVRSIYYGKENSTWRL